MNLRISIHEFETPNGSFMGMNAGEFTGVFAPIPVSEEDQEGMKRYVINRAEHYLALKDESGMTEGEDLTLAEIQASIRENIVTACESGVMSCPDCDGSGKCKVLSGDGENGV
jgi:hypothetical protein